MKKIIQQLIGSLFLLLVITPVYALPMVLPPLDSSTTETGTFTVGSENRLTLTGSPISVTTSLPVKGSDVVNGRARFKSGMVQYAGSETFDGNIANMSLGKNISNGQVVYRLTGLVYGKLTTSMGETDANGNLSVITKPAVEGTLLSDTQVESSHLLLTPRSNINNINPPHTDVQVPKRLVH